MYEKFKEYFHYLPKQLKLPFESGDQCVVLMPTAGEGFHDWYYYLLDRPEAGLRLVRRHRILPELFPTQEIQLSEEMTEANQAIAAAVWQKIADDALKPMGDCAA